MFYEINSIAKTPRDLMPAWLGGRRAVIPLVMAFAAVGAFLSADVRNNASAGPEQAATAPSVKYVSAANGGKTVVTGTSTLHDWTLEGAAIKGNVEFAGQWKADAVPTIALQSIDLSIPVDSLKSTEGSGMNNKVYEALKLKEFPNITYRLTKAGLKAAPAKEGSPYHFDTTGQLTVAGGAHPVNLDLAVMPQDGGKLTVSTEIGLQMTDFGVKPPTAMFGAIKSGDKIAVKVTWQLTTAPSK